MYALVKKRGVYHSLIWLLGFAALFSTIRENSDSLQDTEVLVLCGSILLPVILMVYQHFYWKDRLLPQKNYGRYALAVVWSLASALLLDRVLQHWWSGNHTGLWQTLVNLSSILLLSSGFQFFKRGLVNQYYNQKLKTQNAEAELNLLKAQLNPHFLFNTLNNIYAINQSNAPRGSEMILELSDVMRYHLESSKAEFVSLTKELQLINSYVELEKLRLTEKTKITLDLMEPTGSVRIAPLLFLPFIENAFKYGTHPTQSSEIAIRLSLERGHLLFTVSNSIVADKKVVKTKIGLANTQKRLELIYPNVHKLDINQRDAFFTVNLSIYVGTA